MQKPDLRDIHQLTKDEFKRILGPVAGSLDDGSKVVLGMQSDVFVACCTIQEDQISARGTPRFEQTIKSAYACSSQADNVVWFGRERASENRNNTSNSQAKKRYNVSHNLSCACAHLQVEA